MMDPHAIADAANASAKRAFELKDLFKSMIATSNAGPLPDASDSFEDVFDNILADIGDMPYTPIMQDQQEQQNVYEAFSNFVEGLFELTDGLVANSTELIELDPANGLKLPGAVKSLTGVLDAYCFAISAVFPWGSAYDK